MAPMASQTPESAAAHMAVNIALSSTSATTTARVGQRPGETPDQAIERIVAEYQRGAYGNFDVEPMHQDPIAWDAPADTASGLRTTGRCRRQAAPHGRLLRGDEPARGLL